MTAAGVQTNDSAAYLPPPPSISTPDAKGAGASNTATNAASDAPAGDSQGAPSDFQSELQMQQSGSQGTDSTRTNGPKTGGGKSVKKRDARTDDANPSVVTPVQVADQQKPILPFSLAFVRSQENGEADEKATAGMIAKGSAPLQQSIPLAPVPYLTEVMQGAKPSDDLPSENQAGPSANTQAVSSMEPKLPAAEPIASAIQETANSAPAGPSALAFAARISAAQQKADVSPGASSSQVPAPSPAVSGSQAAVEIPVRYAATAQIIQSAAQPGTQQDETKKEADALIDKVARPDARNDIVLPRFEAPSQSASSSGSPAPQQAAPPTRAESPIEPPPAPPTSSHDIRVRVPDNNGGSTQLRFLESGGEVRVSVRTADQGLAQNLRTHLNDLTQRLSDGGMPAEMWKPAANSASSQNDSQQRFQQDGRGSGGQGSGGQGRQQNREQNRPAWLDEMEASLHGEQS